MTWISGMVKDDHHPRRARLRQEAARRVMDMGLLGEMEDHWREDTQRKAHHKDIMDHRKVSQGQDQDLNKDTKGREKIRTATGKVVIIRATLQTRQHHQQEETLTYILKEETRESSILYKMRQVVVHLIMALLDGLDLLDLRQLQETEELLSGRIRHRPRQFLKSLRMTMDTAMTDMAKPTANRKGSFL